jgi:hypothetical protein
LFSGQLLRVSEGIDILDRLVAPNGFDARETQGEAAGMARTRLDGIESNFQNDVRRSLRDTGHDQPAWFCLKCSVSSAISASV